MKSRYYYIIEHVDVHVTITRKMLPLGPFPILWCNDGMYALIPGTVCEEIFEHPNDDAMQRVWWEQAYELPREVGLLLCDKSYNDARNSS